MDNRLEQALEHANYKVGVARQKQNLKLRLDNLLNYAHNGGIFRVSEALISFVDVLVRNGHTDAVLLDSRENPVKVVDLADFLEKIISLYFEATNEYHAEMEVLRKARTVKQVVGL